MTSQIGFLKLLISRRILSGTLDFEIKRFVYMWKTFKNLNLQQQKADDLETWYAALMLTSGPYFSFFSLIFCCAPTFPYFFFKMPYYSYFFPQKKKKASMQENTHNFSRSLTRNLRINLFFLCGHAANSVNLSLDAMSVLLFHFVATTFLFI